MTYFQLLRAVGGATIGAVAGYLAFAWVLTQGFYGLALPGATLGLGYALSSGVRSRAAGIACGIIAVLVGIYAEWRFFPFAADGSLRYFVSHLYELKPVTLLMITVGGLVAAYCGWGWRPKE